MLISALDAPKGHDRINVSILCEFKFKTIHISHNYSSQYYNEFIFCYLCSVKTTETEILTEQQNRIGERTKDFAFPAQVASLQKLIAKKVCVCGDLVGELNLSGNRFGIGLRPACANWPNQIR